MLQDSFEPIIAHARREQAALLDAYARRYHDLYLRSARAHGPDLHDWRAVWDRVAFAILSANTDSNLAATALRSMRAERDASDWPRIRCTGAPGITPDRLDYVRALPTNTKALTWLKRHRHETWDVYRCRLRDQNHGLGITKASYAVALLYPLTADVCCLDVWMQRHLTNDITHTFQWLSDSAYREAESRVREFANVHDVSTSLGQWIIWDFIRTKFPTSQDWFRA